MKYKNYLIFFHIYYDITSAQGACKPEVYTYHAKTLLYFISSMNRKKHFVLFAVLSRRALLELYMHAIRSNSHMRGIQIKFMRQELEFHLRFMFFLVKSRSHSMLKCSFDTAHSIFVVSYMSECSLFVLRFLRCTFIVLESFWDWSSARHMNKLFFPIHTGDKIK